MENVFSKNNLRLPKSKSADLKKLMVKGEIYPARILNRLSENNYLIEILSRQIIAESSLQFNTDKVFVQVNELDPKIHLRIVSSNLEHLDRILSLARSEKIELDTFNQWCLAELIKSDYSFSQRNITEDLNDVRTLASRLNARHLVPLPVYINLLVTNPEAFHNLPSVLFPEPVPIINSEKRYLAADRPEDLLKTLYHCYINYALNKPGLEKALKKDGIQADLSAINDMVLKLEAYNDFLKPGYSLSGFLVPCEKDIKPLIIEGKRDVKGTDIIDRYEFSFPLENYGSVRVNLRFLEKMLSISYFFYNVLLKEKLIRFEQPARDLAAVHNFRVLPFHYEISLYRTIL